MRRTVLAVIAVALFWAVVGCHNAPSPDDPSSKATAMKAKPGAAGGNLSGPAGGPTAGTNGGAGQSQ